MDGDGFFMFLIVLAFIGLFSSIAYQSGYQNGEVNILSGKAPSYHLVTNDVGEVNWSKK
jgi:hypothetical protein